mmetsp:Transcript_26360/g.38931  ORF Transcript_26360/g.38931 Transcript_26360/m.38931 type:complete len:503 (+) Transcript_26360:144-1652(+)
MNYFFKTSILTFGMVVLIAHHSQGQRGSMRHHFMTSDDLMITTLNDPKTIKTKIPSVIPVGASPGLNTDNQEFLLSATDGDSTFVHPPCKPTNVEHNFRSQKGDFERIYRETYDSNVDMVVSLCDEDFNRVMTFATTLKVQQLYIYSKCGQSIDPSKYGNFPIQIQVLPNVGREGHSFLTHMLRTDLSPNTWTIFFQGQIEKSMQQAMLALAAAHEHDQRNDGTNFINMFRIGEEFCTPMHITLEDISLFQRFHGESRFQSERGSHKYLDVITKQIFYRGEFVVKSSLFSSLDHSKILDIIARLEEGNEPWEGQILERFWIEVLGASDNCRCDGMPQNHVPLENLALNKPAKLSSTIGNFAASNAVDGDTKDALAIAKPQSSEKVSWWIVDLETIGLIKEIVIYNRLDCCKDTLNKAVVEILDQDQKVVSSQSIDDVDPETVTLQFLDYTEGTFVRVTSATEELNLVQVEVRGFHRNVKIPSSFASPPKLVEEVKDTWMFQA